MQEGLVLLFACLLGLGVCHSRIAVGGDAAVPPDVGPETHDESPTRREERAAEPPELKDYSCKYLDGPKCVGCDSDASGGWYVSDNRPKEIDDTVPQVREGQLCLVAQPDEERPYRKEAYRGMRLLLVNASKFGVILSAADSTLSGIVLEAKDKDGQWRPIQSSRTRFAVCGNSFHHVHLRPGYYFEFVVPKYTGDFETKLRYKCSAFPPFPSRAPVYSGEFDGSIYRTQFEEMPEEEMRRLAKEIVEEIRRARTRRNEEQGKLEAGVAPNQ